jgi:hypothetical protein
MCFNCIQATTARSCHCATIQPHARLPAKTLCVASHCSSHCWYIIGPLAAIIAGAGAATVGAPFGTTFTTWEAVGHARPCAVTSQPGMRPAGAVEVSRQRSS